MNEEYQGEKRKISKFIRKRNNKINVYLSDNEKTKLEKLVENKCSISDFFRAKINETKVPNKDIKILINELRRQGGLLKHITNCETLTQNEKKHFYKLGLEMHNLALQSLKLVKEE